MKSYKYNKITQTLQNIINLNKHQKMYDFHDPPFFNARKQVYHLFESQPISRNNSQQIDFIPFNNQRDKLGRLLSRQNQQRQQIKQKYQSLQLNYKKKVIKNNNPQSLKYIKDSLKSDKTVERHFRFNELTKNNKNNKQLNKLRIVSSSNSQKIEIPSIGHYDTAEIMDRIKYKKANKAAITQQKLRIKLKDQQIQEKIIKNITINKGNNNHHSNSQPSTNYKKIYQIDYNLPQLQRYHESKKLKMKHYDNFQQDHEKFKNLVRHSLILANKIKKGLQLD